MELLVLFILIRTILVVDGQTSFCYDINDLVCGPNSPEWGPICKMGTQQSPINLKVTPTSYWSLPSIPKQTIRFNADYRNGASSGYIVNNGHSVQISVYQNVTSSMTVQVSLFPADSYTFAQAHCHFDSEHTYGSSKAHYPMECHFVHYNSKYNSISQALAAGIPGELLIFGVFYQQDQGLLHAPEPFNKAILPFTNNIPRVTQATGMFMPINGPINIYRMLNPVHQPINSVLEPKGWLDFYSYTGSLTTPVEASVTHSCDEGMHWLVNRNPQKISPLQMKIFYTLRNGQGGPMRGNFRPNQPLNGRIVQPVRLHVKN